MAFSSLARTEMRSRYFARAEAQRIGWNVDHPAQKGSFLEENEIVDHFPKLKKQTLRLNRPDFAILGKDRKPLMVVECKADATQLDQAVNEARDYAIAISLADGFDVRIATGIAGTPDKRVLTKTTFRKNGRWVDLKAHGFPLTQIRPLTRLTALLHARTGPLTSSYPTSESSLMLQSRSATFYVWRKSKNDAARW